MPLTGTISSKNWKLFLAICLLIGSAAWPAGRLSGQEVWRAQGTLRYRGLPIADIGKSVYIEEELVVMTQRLKRLADQHAKLTSCVKKLEKSAEYVEGGCKELTDQLAILNRLRDSKENEFVVAQKAVPAQTPIPADAKQKETQALLEARIYTGAAGKKLPYRLLKPDGYDPKQKYPLVLLLHGSGERGDDNEKQLVHGVPEFVREENRKAYPCFLAVPQCPKSQKWADWVPGPRPAQPSEPSRLALELLDSLQKEFSIDTKRIYITGISMGGFGTWDLITRHPERFAAAVPICGGGDPAQMAKVANMPIWAFHGGKDTAVKPASSRDLIEALKKAGGSPKYTEYPDVGHASWVPAYKDPELFQWLFAQKRE